MSPAAGDRYDALVIGGGFFGCSLALHLRRARGARVAILEREDRLMQRASYCNQARVHNGYHYPRSLLTGIRSRLNFPRFVAEFSDCVHDEVEAYYPVARQFSNVTAHQFELFCRRIGAPCEPAPDPVKALFNQSLIEDVFRVTEYTFDSTRLMRRMQAELAEAGVEVRFDTEAEVVRRQADGLAVTARCGEEALELRAERVFNCTYARTNRLLQRSSLPLVPLKHELTEIALVRVPPVLEKVSFTVMCGPFFGVLPFPSRGLHSLYHVRYTLHGAWHDTDGDSYRDPYRVIAAARLESRYSRMVKDAERFLPCMADCEYVESLWEVRTVLPISEHDDSRPILYIDDCGLPGLTCVLGAKIDNIYDMIGFQEQPAPV